MQDILKDIKVRKEGKEKTIRSRAEKITLSIVFAVFVIYSITLVFPFAWMIMNSFKEPFEFYQNVFGLPQNWLVGNYLDAVVNFKVTVGGGSNLRQINLVQMFLTSIFLTALLTVLEVFFSTCTAYVVCKYKFFGRGLIYAMVVISMAVPLVGTLPVTYKFMQDIKLINTVPGLSLVYVSGLGFGFLLLYGHFKNLSWSYAEAASIDGANDFSIFFKIMIPLSVPSMTAVAIVSAITYWNDYATPAIYLKDLPTLAVGVNTLIMEMEKTQNFPLMFACMIIAVIPIIIFFSIFQKTIMENMVTGGLKG